MTKLGLIGHVLRDAIFHVPEIPSKPVKYFPTKYEEHYGGTGANGAVLVRDLGGEPVLFSRVGQDQQGSDSLQDLSELGIDTSQIARLNNVPTSGSSVAVDPNGERQIINQCDPRLCVPSNDFAEIFKDCQSIMIDLHWVDCLPVLCDSCPDIPIIVDADSLPLALDSRLAKAMSQAQYIIFSEPGFERYTEIHRNAAGPVPDWADINDRHQSLIALAKHSPKQYFAITQGPKDVIWAHQDENGAVPAFKIKPISTLGAGDIFHTAFAFAVAEKKSLTDAILFGHAAAALWITKSTITIEKVQNLCDSAKS